MWSLASLKEGKILYGKVAHPVENLKKPWGITGMCQTRLLQDVLGRKPPQLRPRAPFVPLPFRVSAAKTPSNAGMEFIRTIYNKELILFID